MNIKIKQLPESEVEITGELGADEFEQYHDEVLKEFIAEADIPGFRKGHAPTNLVEQKIGEEKLLHEMAGHALDHVYPKILVDNKIDAIGRPEITITKIAKNNPLGFIIKTAVVPEIKLADYKKIAGKETAKKEEPITVEEKEIDEVIKEAQTASAKRSGAPKKDDGTVELPEVNDEFARSLGEFQSVADLREKIKQNIEDNKKYRAKEKKRLQIIEEIIKATKMELPKILVEGELKKMAFEMRNQIENMGLKYEDYLKHIKKTEEDLRKEWQEEAAKRAKFNLIMDKIATEEKIAAEPAELEQEVGHILEHHKDADPARVRAYAESMLVIEKVFQFLESQK